MGQFNNGYALLIGVGGNLPVTAKDAIALSDRLQDPSRAGYPSKQVQLLVNDHANRKGILKAFEELGLQTQNNPDATVVVYFSGHGGLIERPNSDPEYFLVPHEYEPSRRNETAISGVEFTEKILAIKARKLLVFLDCCHAGGVPSMKDESETFTKSPVPPDLLKALDSGQGMVVIASSMDNEASWTGDSYSVFTACLIEGLDGKASVAKDGFARVLDLLIYLLREVPLRTGGKQHPLVKKVLDLGDNFPICYYSLDVAQSAYALTAQIAAGHKSIDAWERQMLREKRNGLRQSCDILTQQINQLRMARVLEASVLMRFQFEQEELAREAMLARLMSEQSSIDLQLQ